MKTLQKVGSIVLAAAVLAPAFVGATTTCNNGGQIWVSKYILINNMWNAGCDTSGWECIWNSTSGSPLYWGTSYNWHTGCSKYQVKAYPSAVSGWFWGTWSSGSGLPVRIWDNHNVYTTGNYTISNPGIQDVSYDCWFHTSSSGGTPSQEMMIWVGAYNGAGPSPDGIRNWTNRGLAYDPDRDFLRYTDETVNHWNKIERPGVLLENGHVAYFTFAVIDVPKDQELPNDRHGSKVIVVPFDGVSLDRDLQPAAFPR
jgi:hypothetical protein